MYYICLEGEEMFNYVWPIVLVIFSNVVYQICAKSVPKEMNPFASLTITYIVGAVASAILYFVLDRTCIHKLQVRLMIWK